LGANRAKKRLTCAGARYKFKTAIQTGRLRCTILRARQPIPASKYGGSGYRFRAQSQLRRNWEIGPQDSRPEGLRIRSEDGQYHNVRLCVNNLNCERASCV
jgi:hypothetical protein